MKKDVKKGFMAKLKEKFDNLTLFGKNGAITAIAGVMTLGTGIYGYNALTASTPEKTVESYFQSIQSGDVSGAIGCCTPDIQAQYKMGMEFSDLFGFMGISSNTITSILSDSNVKAYRNYSFDVKDTVYNDDKNFAKVSVDVLVNDIVTETTVIPCEEINDSWYITNKSDSYVKVDKCKMSRAEEEQYAKLDIVEWAQQQGYSVHHIQSFSNNNLSFVLNNRSIVINDSNSTISLYPGEIKSIDFSVPFGMIRFYDDKSAACTVKGKWILTAVQNKQMCELLSGYKERGVAGFCGNDPADKYMSDDYVQLMNTYGLKAECYKADTGYLFYIYNGTDRLARIAALDHKSSNKAELLGTWNDSTGEVSTGPLLGRESFAYDYVSSGGKLISTPERMEQLESFFAGSNTVSDSITFSGNEPTASTNASPVSVNIKGQINCHGGTVAGYTGAYITENGPVGCVRTSLGNTWHVTAVKQFNNYGITWYELYDSDDGDYYGWVDGNYIDFY
ncbi:hypothetical protein SAMN02910353_02812 [Ruminococcus sp. YRD2003]|uniref:DUF4878 domain-containing protein n=1 Tax=Ruminococcus sp. YRD2003 TaxID=1452313 RepID=UPI0008AB3117|nr:hypothetical protein SAMN02910353_02812 [Ruminococcus flavefaciens]